MNAMTNLKIELYISDHRVIFGKILLLRREFYVVFEC